MEAKKKPWELDNNKLMTMRQNGDGDWELYNIYGQMAQKFTVGHYGTAAKAKSECERVMKLRNRRIENVRREWGK
jgi:hypothetical protein